MSHSIEKEVVFKAVNKAKQLVYGVVLEPDSEDTQGDIISADEIEKTAHDYMRRSRVVGRQHLKKANAEVVESFLAPCDMLIGETKISKGSWVLGVKVNDPAMWAEVEAGDLTGFSIGGVGERVPLNG